MIEEPKNEKMEEETNLMDCEYPTQDLEQLANSIQGLCLSVDS